MLNFNICKNLSCLFSWNYITYVSIPTLNWEPSEAYIPTHRYSIVCIQEVFLGQSHFYRLTLLRLFSEMKPPITLCKGNSALSTLYSLTSPSCIFLTVLQNWARTYHLPWGDFHDPLDWNWYVPYLNNIFLS